MTDAYPEPQPVAASESLASPAYDFFSDERYIDAYPVIAEILTDAITHSLRTDYAAIPQALRGHYADLTREAAEKLAFFLSMKWKETKRNHGGDLAYDPSHDGFADHSGDAFGHAIGASLDHVRVGDAAAHASQSTEHPDHDAYRVVGGSHSLTGSAHRNGQGEKPAPANDDAAPAKRSKKTDAITVWVKENPEAQIAASGFVELGGAKYALCFTHFYHALDRIPVTDANSDWLRFVTGELAGDVLAIERASTGVAARSTMSGFFHEKNTKGTKDPEHDHAAVILQWDGDKPAMALLVVGQRLIPLDMKQEAPTRFNARFSYADEVAA